MLQKTWEEHCYKRTWEEHFLQENIGGALLHGRSGRHMLLPCSNIVGALLHGPTPPMVGTMLLQANMGVALLHGRSGRNIPTSEHGRSNAAPMGGV